MAKISSPEAYFTQVVPQQYTAAMAAAAASVLEQPPLTAIFEIAGPEGGAFALRAAGKQIAVLQSEQVPAPDILVRMALEDWRVFAESGATESIVDYVQHGKVSIVQGLKGTVNLELTRSDGSLWHSSMVFNNQPEPALTIMMTDDDYRSMLRGELNGQMAFLTGKLKFEGSLPLLMQIGALTS